MKELALGQKEIVKRLDTMDAHNAERDEKMAQVINAFPSGDIDGHRAYHETMIEMLQEKRRLRMAIVEKTISGLLWAAIVVVLSALWLYIKEKLKYEQ